MKTDNATKEDKVAALEAKKADIARRCVHAAFLALAIDCDWTRTDVVDPR